MNPYVVRFILANVGLGVLVAVVTEMLKLKSGQGLAFAVTLASSFVAAGAFVKDHARAPTPEERRQFAWRALATAWLVALAFSALAAAMFVRAAELKVLLAAIQSGTILAFVLGGAAALSAVYYVAIRWSFGWYADLAARRA